MQGLFDLDELEALDRSLRLFGYNRPGLVSFHDKDHGDGSGDLRGWVQGELAMAGLAGPWGALRVLCMPRVFGYVFNPLSVYFCHDTGGRLRAILYEVNNTFGERHAYAIPVRDPEGPVRQSCEKAFHVSPFMHMGLRYDFKIAQPDETAGVEISANDREGRVLDARFMGARQPISDRTLLVMLLAYPAMTLKVIVAIHWEALKLWLRGVAFAPRERAGRPEPADQAGAAHHTDAIAGIRS